MFSLLRLVSGSACRWRRAVRLICAGWLPQDELFGWNATAGLKSERGRWMIMKKLILKRLFIA